LGNETDLVSHNAALLTTPMCTDDLDHSSFRVSGDLQPALCILPILGHHFSKTSTSHRICELLIALQ